MTNFPLQDEVADTLSYCLKITLHFISSPSFRRKVSFAFLFVDRELASIVCLFVCFEVLELLVTMYEQLDEPDYISVCQVSTFIVKHGVSVTCFFFALVLQCLIFLDNPHGTAEILETLAKGNQVSLKRIVCVCVCVCVHTDVKTTTSCRMRRS